MSQIKTATELNCTGTHEEILEITETDALIADVEKALEKGGQLHDARTALTSLRRKIMDKFSTMR